MRRAAASAMRVGLASVRGGLQVESLKVGTLTGEETRPFFFMMCYLSYPHSSCIIADCYFTFSLVWIPARPKVTVRLPLSIYKGLTRR